MLKVALLNDSFSPQFDGVAVCAENYAKIIEREYGKSFVIVPEEKNRDITSFPFQVIEYPATKTTMADQYRIGLPITPGFRKKIFELSIDLIHSHTPFVSGLLGHRYARKKKVPHVSTFHSKYKDDINQRISFHSEFSDDIITNYIASFYRNCDSVWAVSHGTADTLRGYGYHGDIYVMRNGCDMDIKYHDEATRREVATTYGLNPGEPIFLFVGRLTKLKNIHLVIQALGALKRGGREFSMLFVGAGEDEDKLRDLIKEHDLEENVKLAGKVMNRDRLSEIYSSCDLFVFPSVYDNAPLVVLEAAACGCASLLIKGSNSAEGVTNGVNGILVEERIEDISLGVNDALNKYDLRKLGDNARRDLYISWNEVLKMAVEKYQQLLTDWKPKDETSSLLSFGDIDLFEEIKSTIPDLADKIEDIFD